MAPRRNPAPPPAPAAPPAAAPPAADSTAAADGKPAGPDWGALAAPIAMPTKNTFTGITVDAVGTTPEPIRQRAEASLIINTARVKAKATSTASRPRVDYHWDMQPVADKDMGEQFIKLLTRYAKYRPTSVAIPHAGPDSPTGQVTVRTGEVNHYRKDSSGDQVVCQPDADGAQLGVRYSVRPLEQRSSTRRLPGTAS